LKLMPSIPLGGSTLRRFFPREVLVYQGMQIAPLDIGFITVYIVLVIGIGFWSARKQTASDYLIHGRGIKTFSFIATVSASWVGGGAVVAFGAYVYEFGVVTISVYIGVVFSMLLFAYYAPRIREEGHRLGHLTMADYFHEHFGTKAGTVAAVVLTVVYFLYTVNQFIAGSAVLSTIAGWSYETALFTSAIVVLIYLLLGGMRSVVKTDIFQYVAMVLLIFVIGIAMIRETGVDPELLNLRAMSPTLLLAFILYGLFIPFSSAEIWQRIFAAKDDTVVRRGLIGSGFCILLLGGAIMLLGLAAKTAYPNITPQEAVPYGMVHLLPTGLLGLGLVVLFAAIMSTLDTLVFYLATAIAKDYGARFFGKSSEQDLQRITKIFIVVTIVVSVLFAYVFRDLIAVVITIAGIAAALVPPVLASFHFKLKGNAVSAALIASCIYIAGLVLTGNLSPDLAMISLFVSGIVLFLWQKLAQ